MRVLFDQGTPVPLRTFLTGHMVRTAAQEGWDSLSNGELLRVAEAAGFDVLVTPDKNLPYQQNLTGLHMAVVVLGNAQWPVLRRHALRVAEVVNAAKAASVVQVDVPQRER